MRKYPLYKPSGIEWLGQFPDNWSFRTIRRITREHRQGYYIAEDYLEDGVKLVRITDLHENGDIDYSEMPYVKITPENEKGYSILEGDFLFPRTGSIGLLGYVKQPERSVFASYLIRFRFKNKEILSDFLYYYFISDVFISGIFSDLHGGVNQNIHAENIKDQYIVFPSNLKEQHSIVRFLDYKTAQIDSFIANRQKQIELLKEQKAGIINKAVTKGINPNAKMKASGIEWIGDIPEHWRVSKVKFVSKVKGRIGFRGYTVNDLVEEGQGALTLGATHINKDGEIDLSKAVYISWDKYYESPEIMVEKEDILVVQRGSVGVVGIVNYDIGFATINPSLVVLKRIKMNRQLLFLQLRSKIVKEGITTIFNETAVPMLSQNQISNFNILLPPTLDEQQSIIDYIKSEVSIIDTLISKYQKQIDLMQEYRTSLISQAVTGKIDVRDWKPKIKEYSIEKPENLLVAEE